MQATMRTVVGVFDDYGTALKVVDELVEAGYSRDTIDITPQTMENRGPRETGGFKGFFKSLFGDSDYATDYEESVRRGSTVVYLTTEDSRVDLACNIMERNNAIDIDEKAASWRGQGVLPENESTSRRGFQEHGGTFKHNGGTTGHSEERTIPVVREDVRVGKKAVPHGGVRVFSRVHEDPVEQEVTLNEERVHVDRRKVDRPATDADMRMRDEVIEVHEMGEEPVISKETRVVEEVVIGKENVQRTERVRATTRTNDVEVERLDESNDPAYDFGCRMARDPRYGGRRWDEVETNLRSDYERDYPGSKWEEFKASVRRGWDKMTGQR